MSVKDNMILYETKLDVSRAGLSHRLQQTGTQSCTQTHTHTHTSPHTPHKHTTHTHTHTQIHTHTHTP